MGLRVVAFAAAFNLLLWTTRLTLGCSVERRHGVGAALLAALLAPTALLLLARRVSPPRASAFAMVAAASLLVAGFGTAAL